MFQAIAILALVGLAAGPTPADLPDAALLCGSLGEPVAQSSGPGPASPVFCQADCYPYTDVSCSGNVSCQAVDRNCPYQRGYVVCDGYYTYCPICPQCTNGEIRLIGTGNCCDYPGIGEEFERQKCINEQWVTQAMVCRRSPNCPFIP